VRAAFALLVVLLLAGCAGSNRAPTVKVPPIRLPDIEVEHDHTDPAAHQVAVGLSLAGFIDAKPLLGAEPARFSDIQSYGNITVVTINGRTQGSPGGFYVFDASTPTVFELLSRYRSGSEDNWYTKFSPDGKFIFLTANGGAGPQPVLNGVASSATNGAPFVGARGIQVVDIHDPRAPKLAFYYPAPVRVINYAPFVAKDGKQYLFASMTYDRVSRSAGAASSHDLNFVSVLEFDPTRPSLLEVARWQPKDAATIEQAFPHDLAIGLNPFNGRPLLFVAYWDAGGYVLDITDPRAPVQISRVPSMGPGDHVHTFKPHDLLIDGHYYAVLAPETFVGEPAGHYRLIDLTDAKKPRLAAAWTPPPGIEANAQSLLFSPHEFSLSHGRLYASQNHGGVWILDLPGFRPVATWQTSIGDPARTKDWAVDIETAVAMRGYVYAVDMGTGVVVLQEDGPSTATPARK
jgi:hypothetical protein